MNERTQFEDFVVSKGHYDRREIELARLANDYRRAILSYMWEAWQARAQVSAGDGNGTAPQSDR